MRIDGIWRAHFRQRQSLYWNSWQIGSYVTAKIQKWLQCSDGYFPFSTECALNVIHYVHSFRVRCKWNMVEWEQNTFKARRHILSALWFGRWVFVDSWGFLTSENNGVVWHAQKQIWIHSQYRFRVYDHWHLKFTWNHLLFLCKVAQLSHQAHVA